MKSKIHFFLLLCLIGALISAAPLDAQGDEAFTVYIQQINTENFPAVQIDFRALNIPAELDRSQLTVRENDTVITDFTLTPDMAPMHTIFIIDRGRYANYTTGRNERGLQTLLKDFTGYFREGIDTVEIRERSNNEGEEATRLLISRTDNHTEFRRAIDTLELNPTGTTYSLESIREAIDDVIRDPFYIPGNTAIVLITPNIDDVIPYPDTQAEQAITYAIQAEEAYIPIYTIDTRGRLPDTLQILSEDTGGQYVQIDLQRYSISDITALYSQIETQQRTYILNYTSPIRSDEPVTVQITSSQRPPEDTRPSEQIIYTPQLNRPEITLNLTSVSVLRQGTISGNLPVFDIDTIQLDITIQHDRPLETLQLEIATGDNTIVENFPVPENEQQFTLSWNITDYTEPGSYSPVLTIRATDDAGFTGSSQPVQINIQVDIAPAPIAQSTPISTPINPSPTAIAMQVTTAVNPTASPVTDTGSTTSDTILSVSESEQQATDESCEGLACINPVLLATGSSIAAIILFMLILSFFRRGHSTSVKQEPAAYLIITEGPHGLSGEKIELYPAKKAVRFGRDPDEVDHTFYEKETHSTVSRFHCTVRYHAKGRYFSLADEDSANGTWINNQRIEEARLQHGDSVILGDKDQRSVKLTFYYVEHAGASHSVADTYVVPPQKKAQQATAETITRDYLIDSNLPGRDSILDSQIYPLRSRAQTDDDLDVTVREGSDADETAREQHPPDSSQMIIRQNPDNNLPVAEDDNNGENDWRKDLRSD